MCDLRRWKVELKGDLSAAAVRAVLEKSTPAAANRLFTVINRYAKYRNQFADPRLALALAVPMKIKRTPKREKPPISPKQRELYWALAEKLCREGDKTGIWIALSLLGVNPSSLSAITIKDFYLRIPDKGEIKAPAWLCIAMSESRDWVMNRFSIWKKVKQYGCSPRELIISSSEEKHAPALDGNRRRNSDRPQAVT
jgi:hypothetical protein